MSEKRPSFCAFAQKSVERVSEDMKITKRLLLGVLCALVPEQLLAESIKSAGLLIVGMAVLGVLEIRSTMSR